MRGVYALAEGAGALGRRSNRGRDPGFDVQYGFPGRPGAWWWLPCLISFTRAPWEKRRLTLYFRRVLHPSSPRRREMSYKAVVNAKRTKREEAIRETVVLTTRELSQEEGRIASSSGTFYLGQSSQSVLITSQRGGSSKQSRKVDGRLPRS